MNTETQHICSYYQGGIRKVHPTTHLHIDEVLQMIKDGKYHSEIAKLRELRATDEKAYKKAKSSLDYVTFSGTFSKRENESLLEHSGFLSIDFDDCEDVMDQMADWLYTDPHTYAFFLSPSGEGYKVLVPIKPEYHAASFAHMEMYYLETYGLQVDTACKDVARACFMSSDPALFINKEAKRPIIPLDLLNNPDAYYQRKHKEVNGVDNGKKVATQPQAATSTRLSDEAMLMDKYGERVAFTVKNIIDKNVNITANYDDWLQVGFALSTLGNYGRDIYHTISRMDAAYDYKSCDSQFDNCVETRKNIKTPAKLFSVAEKYQVDTRPPKDKKKDLLLPEGVDEDEFMKYGFYESGGTYHSLGNRGMREVSNFTMQILYHVQTGAEEAYRLIAITNVHGYNAVINMNTDDFVSLASFRKTIARRGNFLWKGAEEDLIRLQDKLQREEKATKMIDVLGHHPKGGFYAFANGIINTEKLDGTPEFKEIDEYGIVSHGEQNYFIPALSKMYKDKDELFENYKKFKYTPRTDTLQEWFKLFNGAYGDNSKLGFAFYVSCIFSDIVFKALGGRFPMLYCYGQRGTGKGAFIQSILYNFGEPQEQIMLGGSTTAVGFMRSFAQFRNAIVWLDEYKNNLHPKVIESLKNVYDRIGYKRGKKDNSFDTSYVPINSGAIVSGQDMPTIEPALFTRTVMLTFKESKKRSEQTRKAFKELQKMQRNGLSHLTIYLLRYGSYFKEKFSETFEEIATKLIKDLDNPDIEGRMVENYSCLLAAMKLILDNETLGFKYHSFYNLVMDTLINQHNVLAGSDDVSKFWQIMQDLFNQDIIRENRDFILKDGYLFLKVQNVVGPYLKEMRNRQDANTLQKSTLENYLQIDKKQFVKRAKKQFPDGSYTWCMQFHYDVLDINLLRFKETATKEEIDRKYREMKIERDVEEKNTVAQEQPEETEEEELNRDEPDWGKG